jgi:hypothetical protein
MSGGGGGGTIGKGRRKAGVEGETMDRKADIRPGASCGEQGENREAAKTARGPPL